MLFDHNPEVVTRSTQPKTLIISIAFHALLVLVVLFNPDWFDTMPHRTIRIAGEDFDLSKLQIQTLYLPPIRPAPATPAPAPVPVPAPEVVQPQQAAPPPPPPPPPRQPPPPPPDRIIRPDDQLIEGARPDGSPRASRGNTQELRNNALENQRAQQAQDAQKAQDEQKARQAQQGKTGTDRILPPNTNPNAMPLPQSSLLTAAGKIVDGAFDASRRNGQTGRTGITRSDNNGSFSTDSEVEVLSPNPKGIDFGPYLNQLLSKLRSSWYSVMPEMARLGQKGRVDITFSVTKTGLVKDVKIVRNSNYEPLDQAARSAVLLSNPFNKLPAEYETDLMLHIGFLYNMDR